MTFKDRVREEMKFQGLTAKELAAKVGISVNTLNMYIGYRESLPSVEIGIKIAKSLNVSLEYLVTGINPNGINFRDNISQKVQIQKEILSITNKMSEKQLTNFLLVAKLFIQTSEK